MILTASVNTHIYNTACSGQAHEYYRIFNATGKRSISPSILLIITDSNINHILNHDSVDTMRDSDKSTERQ